MAGGPPHILDGFALQGRVALVTGSTRGLGCAWPARWRNAAHAY